MTSSAMHEGAFARNLAVHLVQLSVIIVVSPEDVMCDVVNEHEEAIRQGDPILVEADIKGEKKETLLVGILTPFDLLYAPQFKA